MHRKKLLSLFSLKWNPFTPDVPTEALLPSPRIESFCARVQNMIHDGGFALLTGEPGAGKSATLRLLEHRLSELPDVAVGVFSRPQSNVADFYRELGELFAVELRPHNRWSGFKTLRERWKAHAATSLLKPVLVVDDAQQMDTDVLSELRILSNGHLDTETYITVALAGDLRLAERLRTPELLPLGTRIRTRLLLDHASRDDLRLVLRHAIQKAGAPQLLTEALQDALVDHAAGNYRVLMMMAGELLLAAADRDLSQLDEKLFLELYGERSAARRAKTRQPA